MQIANVYPAVVCAAPSARAPWQRLRNGLRNHVFWIISLAVHAAVLSLAMPLTRFIPPDTDPIVITAMLAPPGRAPTVEVPPISPPPKASPTPHRNLVTVRTLVHAPRISFALPRFIAARASAPVWGFWFPSCASGVDNGQTGPSAPATATGTRTSDGDGGSFTAPSYRKTPLPAYPSIAKSHRWEGVTVLHVEVLTDGSVHRVELLRSSGHHELDESALKAVQNWQFEPARRSDVAVACFIQVPIRFKLEL
jgi:periplasmic protein TonB